MIQDNISGWISTSNLVSD